MRRPPSAVDLDAVQRQFGHVDEEGGPLDTGLHQVDEVGAAAEEPCVRVGASRATAPVTSWARR
ncbi:hypothetical protein SCYAM73S_08157 [Streptomyces cyaneofuscatus]